MKGLTGTGNPYSVQTEEAHIYNYRLYKCPDCQGEFDQPGYIENEWRKINPAMEERVTGYCCPFCGRKMRGVK